MDRAVQEQMDLGMQSRNNRPATIELSEMPSHLQSMVESSAMDITNVNADLLEESQ